MPHFRVKAVYEYSSPHEDDLSFGEGQVITVTEEEDADWYVGEFVDGGGTKHEGLFPRNFVEKLEPEPPPRPNRASRHKPTEQASAAAAPPTPEVPQQEPVPAPAPVEHEEPAPAETAASPTSPRPAPSAKEQEALSPQEPPAPKPAPAAAPAGAAPSGKKPPPPVAAKSNAFRDRIAAFNQPAAQPIQPFKPGGGPANFIKKPFVAPPPSRDAYVPPPREAPQAKAYRRDEDPEIAQRQAEDHENAIKAGFAAEGAPPAASGEEGEDQPKPTSLKERIALLQKQQQEQAQRAAAQHKDKPKKPPMKKRTESHDRLAEDSEDPDAHMERVMSGESRERGSTDSARPPRSSHGVKSPSSLHPNRDFFSDGNDADQSGAGDTEDAEGTSTSVEEDDERKKTQAQRAPTAPPKEPNVGDEQDVEEEEEDEEDEMDAEERRKLELRQRMAKMSGGMGMAGMLGGGLPMGGAPPKKKKPAPEKRSTEESEEYASPQQRVPMFPIQGVPQVRSPGPEDRQLDVEREDEEPHPITQTHPAEELPDVEDITPQSAQRTPAAEQPPPVPSESKFLVPRKPVDGRVGNNADPFQLSPSKSVSKQYIAWDGLSEYVMTVSVSRRPVPPPVPSAERPAPPPVPSASRPTQQIRSPSPGSESGDELTDAAPPPPPPQPESATSPKTPSAMPPSKRSSYLASDEMSQDSPDKRAPPSPTMSPTAARPPPPPPPTGAPPSRHATADSSQKGVDDRTEGETDYEGDYDTDIAPGATHKDALKAHAREPSVDDSTIADEPVSARSPTTPSGVPPIPQTAPRAVPPPPPQQPPSRPSIETPRGAPPPPSRPSMDSPRGAPPPPPVPPPAPQKYEEDDDEYDPYRYTGPPAPPPRAVPPAPRAVPPPPQSQPPPPQNRPPPPMPPSIPPVPQQHQAAESSEDDDLYTSPPPRKSHDRPPPPPPQAPPHQHRPPPPPQMPSAPPPPPAERPAPPPPPPAPAAEPPQQPRPSMGRKSLDVNRSMQGRVSMDQPRPSASQEFIASDVDLGASSHWWTQQNMPPPSLQGRRDVLLNIEEAREGNVVEKAVFVLYMDYSQTIVSARFDMSNVSDVELEQRHEPPPPRLRQDQLENAHEKYGVRIAKDVESKQNSVVGDGTPQGLITALLAPYRDALSPVSTRAFGALVYANLANATVQQYDEIRPGDIVSFRNAKFQGKHGAMHAKYSVDVGKPDHVGVVVEWDGSKKKVRAWEQGRESKKVKPESFRMGDLRSGEVRVWRVMGKNWVGWN